MRLYNSATGAVERFRPRPGQPVTTYVCGITPYDTTHIGHAFTYVTFDVLIRHLEVVHGWPVLYAQNLTDIDDDILRRAGALSVDWRELGHEWTDRFVTDMRRLGVRPPDAFPAASGAIGAIIDATSRLLGRGAAYSSGGSVYLRLSTVAKPDAGLAAGDLDRDELLELANERGNVGTDPQKEHPLDAVLWQAAANGEPAWPSPWGPGRPGWHIECAAMAHAELGDVVDIHGGGDDLRFPHHACESIIGSILDGTPSVRWWMHTAMVHKDGQKMAKSVGNLVMVESLLRDHHPDAIRLYLLTHHYRATWEWDRAAFERGAALVRTLHGAMARESAAGRPLDPAPFGPRFSSALDDDLNTPAALDACLALADAILEAPMRTDVRPGQDILATLAGRVLGLFLGPAPADFSLEKWPAPTTTMPQWEHWHDPTAASTVP